MRKKGEVKELALEQKVRSEDWWFRKVRLVKELVNNEGSKLSFGRVNGV